MPFIRPKQGGLSIELNVTLWLLGDLFAGRAVGPLTEPLRTKFV
jgi:hypothetical protein